MAIKPETAIVDSIQRWVHAHSGKSVKFHGDAMSELGTPDLFIGIPVVYYGTIEYVHLVVEVKTDTGETSPMQDYRLREWAAVGFYALTVRSLGDFIGKLVKIVRSRTYQSDTVNTRKLFHVD